MVSHPGFFDLEGIGGCECRRLFFQRRVVIVVVVVVARQIASIISMAISRTTSRFPSLFVIETRKIRSAGPAGSPSHRHQNPPPRGIRAMRRKDHAARQQAGGLVLRVGRTSFLGSIGSVAVIRVCSCFLSWIRLQRPLVESDEGTSFRGRESIVSLDRGIGGVIEIEVGGVDDAPFFGFVVFAAKDVGGRRRRRGCGVVSWLLRIQEGHSFFAEGRKCFCGGGIVFARTVVVSWEERGGVDMGIRWRRRRLRLHRGHVLYVAVSRAVAFQGRVSYLP